MEGSSSDDTILLRLHGVSLRLHSQSSAFASYVRVVMEPYVVESSDHDAPADISTRLEWVDGVPAKGLREAFGVTAWQRQPDRDLFISGKTGYWLRVDEFPQMYVAASWLNGQLTVTGRYYFHLGCNHRLEPLRRLRYRRHLAQLESGRFSTLLYYLVYYPLLWWWTRFSGQHVVHGAAVATEGGALVFVGMPGCGKSTLAVSLLAEEGWTLLSDNLLLYDRDGVRACPELLLLDEPSLKRVGGAATRLVATGERRVFARNAYRADRVTLGPVPVAVFACLGRGLRSSIGLLDTATCVAQVHAANTMAKEVRRFEVMAVVLDAIAGTCPGNADADLVALLRSAACHEVWLASGDRPDEALAPLVEKLKKPAKGAPL